MLYHGAVKGAKSLTRLLHNVLWKVFFVGNLILLTDYFVLRHFLEKLILLLILLHHPEDVVHGGLPCGTGVGEHDADLGSL